MATLKIARVEVRCPGELVRHGVLAGVVAAIVLAAEEIVATVLLGGTPGAPFRLIASTVFGPLALSPSYPLAVTVLVGAAIHLTLSVLFGVIFVFIVALFYQLSARAPLLLLYGVLYGLALWELNVLTVLSLLFPGAVPRFSLANQIWNGVIAYAVFYGLVLGAYVVHARPGVVGDWTR
ncbi:MAG TPA: hypothetical protein VFB73_18490 [Chloroflexota bacterium]|nr:hypothetical protein [Chloroflexota bacterium]